MNTNITEIPKITCCEARRIYEICGSNDCGYTATQYAFIKKEHEICQQMSQDVIYGFKIFFLFSFCLIALVAFFQVLSIWMDSK
jgi:hypothetical protein